MSFGSSTRGVAAAATCPCGSGAAFGRCCGPLLAGEPAPTAERLMRSRYTAFAVGDAPHLLRTWHPRTRPESVTIDPHLRWTGLSIDESTEAADEAVVAFRATWRDESGAGVLVERSRFARRAGRWFYLDAQPG